MRYPTQCVLAGALLGGGEEEGTGSAWNVYLAYAVGMLQVLPGGHAGVAMLKHMWWNMECLLYSLNTPPPITLLMLSITLLPLFPLSPNPPQVYLLLCVYVCI